MAVLKTVGELGRLRTRLRASAVASGCDRVKVCCGTACNAMGSQKVVAAFKNETTLSGKKIEIVKTGCQGLCQKGPVMRIEPYGYFYQRVGQKNVHEIVSKTFVSGRPARRLLYRESVVDDPFLKMEEIPFYKKQLRMTLRNNGIIDPCNIEHYVAADGYSAFEKALSTMTPAHILDEITYSKLRGRGGGGFPTGLKWQTARNAPGDVKLVIANGDEGDPGAFMDRSLMEGDPHSLLEGMMLCAYAVGARYGIIYVRHEYPLAVSNLRNAVRQAERLGLLGKRILGTDFSFAVTVREGAGAFVCGEETALMRSVEGYRGFPTPRPPYPAVKGLWEMPTVINNVETLAQIPRIVNSGAAHYKSVGTERSAGTKIFALTGKVVNTGLIEVPMGITVREVIFDIGGGIRHGRQFKAVQTGGPSGGCLSEEQLDLTVDYDSLSSAGSMMGSGGMVVMDEDNCMVDIAKYFLSFTQRESCGKCPPCRIGTYQMLEILERITSGDGEEGDIERLERLGQAVRIGSLCGLGKTAPNPVLTSIRYFREEYEEHIKDKFCRANVCTGIGVYRIEGSECYLCGLCKKACAFDAVVETRNAFYIDIEYCTKCKACFNVCPVGAVKIGRQVIPWVIPEQCEGCSDCVDACVAHGLKMCRTGQDGVFLPWLADPDSCVSCGQCAAVCATGGVVMTTHVEDAKERFLNKRPMGLIVEGDEENDGDDEGADGVKEKTPAG